MDTFVEQIIKKKKTPVDMLIMVATALAALIVSAAIIKFISVLLPMTVLVIWGAYWLITSRNREFEYSITNGEMDIDCIIAKRRRKRVTSVTCSKVEAFGRYDPTALTGRRFDATIMAASAANAQGNYYFTYRSKAHGNTLVIFEPDERVKEAFVASLPRLMQIELEKKERAAQ